MAPHLTAELWERRHPGEHVHEQRRPEADPDLAKLQTITMVVQVNGKVRDRIEVDPELTPDEAEAPAMASPKVQELLGDGGTPTRVVARPPKLVNVVL